MKSMQLDFDLFSGFGGTYLPKVAAAIEKLSMAAGTDSRGAIFTRAEVVDFILDLAGYTQDKPLHPINLMQFPHRTKQKS